MALALADCQTYVEETGALPAAIAVNGGGAKSRFWMKILASAIGRTVLLNDGAEAGPAVGAARLARMALTGETPDAVCTKPPVTAEIEPDPGLAAAYQGKLARFRSLYRALKPEFHA